MTRIKFCGLTRKEDIKNAVNAGADALGFVFYAPSPRSVSVEQSRELMSVVPAFVSIVALVVNPSDEDMQAVLSLPIDIIQFHGDETAKDCQRLAQGKRWIKAIQVKPDHDIRELADNFMQAGASGILLDGYDPAQPELKGGTGSAFDWGIITKLNQATDYPVILAGGLTPENVGLAIEQAKPFAVDVSGGIEQRDDQGKALKGIKDKDKMLAFARNCMG